MNNELVRPLKKPALFAILIMPFVWLFEGAVIAAALADLESGLGISYFQGQFAYSIVFLTSIVFSVIAGVAAKRVDKKKLAVIGMLIYGVMGVLPAFANNIWVIAGERFIMGIGVGLVLPMSNAYIADYFVGETRSRMFGYASTVSMVANIAATFIGGWLLGYGWRYNFYAFFIVLIIMILCLIFLPKSPITKAQREQQKKADKTSPKMKLPRAVWFLTLLMAFSWGFFLLVILNDAEFMLQRMTTFATSHAFLIGVSMAFPTGGAAIMGAIYAWLHRKTKNWVPFISMAFQAVGFLVYIYTHTYAVLCIANFLTGLGVGLITPFVVDIAVKRVKPEQHDRTSGIATAGIHFGQFCSPFIQLLITAVLVWLVKADLTADLGPLYAALAVVFAVAAILSLFYLKHKEPEEQVPVTQQT